MPPSTALNYMPVLIAAVLALTLGVMFSKPLPFEVHNDFYHPTHPTEKIPVTKIVPEILHKSLQVEDLCFDTHDNMYGGTTQGEVFKFLPPDYTEKKLLTKWSTWPLSIAYNPFDKKFYVANPLVGLMSFQLNKKQDKTVNELILIHLNFANQVSVGPDGMVYVTDSMNRNDPTKTKLINFYDEMFSGAATGQLLQYNPFEKTSKVLISADSSSLRIGNGIAISNDNRFAYVQGMLDGSIGRYSLEKDQVDDLYWSPTRGFPDNMVTREEGLYGALVIQRSFMTNLLFHSNWPRRILYRLPAPPLGQDPCLVFFIPKHASEPVGYVELNGIPACNCAVPHSDGHIYTSSYLLDGAVARFKNPWLTASKD